VRHTTPVQTGCARTSNEEALVGTPVARDLTEQMTDPPLRTESTGIPDPG
jgi:hypothetical protein